MSAFPAWAQAMPAVPVQTQTRTEGIIMSIYLYRQFLDSTPRQADAFQDESVFRLLGRAIMRNVRRRRMIRQLQELDDHILADIGISRGDIPRVVDGLDARELRMTPVARPVAAQAGAVSNPA